MSTLNRSDAALGRELVVAFGTFGPAYMKWVSAQARDQGVTYARMKTLRALQCDGPQIMSSLRDRLGVTARSVTALVDALENDALVRRVAHPHDRRATIIELTDAGRNAVEGLFEAHIERAAEVFSRLDEDDQRHLLRILRRLSQTLSELGGAHCYARPEGP